MIWLCPICGSNHDTMACPNTTSVVRTDWQPPLETRVAELERRVARLEGEPRVAGMPVVLDPDTPVDQIEIRDDVGRTIAVLKLGKQ